MRYCLYYNNSELGEAWEKEFSGFDNVEIISGNILETNCDAVVSPANSFGFMDGGLDLALSEKFGWHIQDKLRELILALPEKELLVGKSLVVETGYDVVRYIVSAPTMRVPMDYNIADSINAYLAMKAIIISAKENEKIHSIAIPGLCTGVGKMSPSVSAHQMFKAFSEIELGNHPVYNDFGDAQKYQIELNPYGKIWN